MTLRRTYPSGAEKRKRKKNKLCNQVPELGRGKQTLVAFFGHTRPTVGGGGSSAETRSIEQREIDNETGNNEQCDLPSESDLHPSFDSVPRDGSAVVERIVTDTSENVSTLCEVEAEEPEISVSEYLPNDIGNWIVQGWQVSAKDVAIIRGLQLDQRFFRETAIK
jgi:hypothetical protein